MRPPQRLGFAFLLAGWLLYGLERLVLPRGEAGWVAVLSYICLATAVFFMWVARSQHSKARRGRMTTGALSMTVGLAVAAIGQLVASRSDGPDIGLGGIIFGGHAVILIGSRVISSASSAAVSDDAA